MKSSITNLIIALAVVGIGVAIAATGIYVGETDDAPGASLYDGPRGPPIV